MNETYLEGLGLQWFAENGWQILHGLDIAPDSDTPYRSSYNQVLLEHPLREAIQRINPHLKQEETDEVIHKLRTIAHPVPVMRNKFFHSMLLDGVSIEIERHDKRELEPVRIIDFVNTINNTFQVVSQFTIQGTKQPRRPDIVAFY